MEQNKKQWIQNGRADSRGKGKERRDRVGVKLDHWSWGTDCIFIDKINVMFEHSANTTPADKLIFTKTNFIPTDDVIDQSPMAEPDVAASAAAAMSHHQLL